MSDWMVKECSAWSIVFSRGDGGLVCEFGNAYITYVPILSIDSSDQRLTLLPTMVS